MSSVRRRCSRWPRRRRSFGAVTSQPTNGPQYQSADNREHAGLPRALCYIEWVPNKTLRHTCLRKVVVVARFATTQWSVVLKARDGPAVEASDALGELCRTYWYPIYAFVLKSCHDPCEAEDLTQSYFTCLVEKDFLKSVQPQAGLFRSFLLASLKHFLSNEWDRQKTQKRGGHLRRVGLVQGGVASREQVELADHLTPEDVFERRWAQTLAERALGKLQGEWEARGKGNEFQLLEGCLLASHPETNHQELASRLGISQGATRVTVHRLRKRYGRLLRDEIGSTVSKPSEIDEELRHVLEVLAES